MIYGSVFLLCVVSNRTGIFTKMFACIVINETHLVWELRSFYKDYASLGTLHHYYSKVLLIALSTRLTLNVLKYIRKSLNIQNFVCVYKRSMDCSNIIQMVAKTKDPKKIDKLGCLNLTASVVSAIPKTMVFVDYLDERVILGNHLHNLLPVHMKKDRKRLIRTFISRLEPDTKAKYRENFHNGNTRIWICIDAAQIRVDIGNIVPVIQ